MIKKTTRMTLYFLEDFTVYKSLSCVDCALIHTTTPLTSEATEAQKADLQLGVLVDTYKCQHPGRLREENCKFQASPRQFSNLDSVSKLKI